MLVYIEDNLATYWKSLKENDFIDYCSFNNARVSLPFHHLVEVSREAPKVETITLTVSTRAGKIKCFTPRRR